MFTSNSAVCLEAEGRLSYTTFSYSGVHAIQSKQPTKGELAPGGYSNLYEEIYSVKARYFQLAVCLGLTCLSHQITVKNDGKVEGNATPQLYIQFPSGSGEPPLVMRGFEKVMLRPGESKEICFSLRLKDVSIWDTLSGAWKVPQGQIVAHVGESSRALKAKVALKEI